MTVSGITGKKRNILSRTLLDLAAIDNPSKIRWISWMIIPASVSKPSPNMLQPVLKNLFFRHLRNMDFRMQLSQTMVRGSLFFAAVIPSLSDGLWIWTFNPFMAVSCTPNTGENCAFPPYNETGASLYSDGKYGGCREKICTVALEI